MGAHPFYLKTARQLSDQSTRESDHMPDCTTASFRENAKQILHSHLSLGRRKAVSYLPIKTVEKVIGLTVTEYRSMVEATGNRCSIFGPKDCCIDSGAIYAYSYHDLHN